MKKTKFKVDDKVVFKETLYMVNWDILNEKEYEKIAKNLKKKIYPIAKKGDVGVIKMIDIPDHFVEINVNGGENYFTPEEVYKYCELPKK